MRFQLSAHPAGAGDTQRAIVGLHIQVDLAGSGHDEPEVLGGAESPGGGIGGPGEFQAPDFGQGYRNMWPGVAPTDPERTAPIYTYFKGAPDFSTFTYLNVSRGAVTETL